MHFSPDRLNHVAQSQSFLDALLGAVGLIKFPESVYTRTHVDI